MEVVDFFFFSLSQDKGVILLRDSGIVKGLCDILIYLELLTGNTLQEITACPCKRFLWLKFRDLENAPSELTPNKQSGNFA